MYVAFVALLVVLWIGYLVLQTHDGEADVPVQADWAAQDGPVPVELTAVEQAMRQQINAANAAIPANALPPARTGLAATTPPFDTFDTIGAEQTERATTLGKLAYAAQGMSKKVPPVEDQCSGEDVPCDPQVVWQNIFPGCGTFHIPLEGKDYRDDPRVWQGDLNPKLLERQALQGKEWNPYEHMNARQAWIQFITTNWSGRSDRYTRPVDDLNAVKTCCANEVEPPVMY